MAINTTAQAALDGRSTLIGSWVEIEGLPNAYGTFAATSSFFSGRATAEQLSSIKSKLAAIPKVIDQTIDTLKGGNLSSGQVVLEVLDADGEPTDWTNITPPTNFITTAITASQTSFDLYNVLGYSAGMYLYAGSETMKITGVVGSTVTVLRGQYRSKAQAYGARFPISLVPFTMANRRVWYYQVFDAGSKTPGTWATSLVLDDIKVLRFSGVLRECRLKDGDPNVYVLTAESVDREIDRQVFRNLRQFRISGTSIKDGLNTGSQPCQVAGWPGYAPGYDRLNNFDPTGFTVNENLLLQIDNEIFAGTVISLTPAEIQLKARALFGTTPDVHKEGAVARELVPMCAKSNQTNTGQNIPWHSLVSKFNAIPLYGGDVGPDHPVILALTLLCSTGTGTNFDAVYRNCDRLPADWGLGVDHTRIDWEACEAAAREDPALRFGGLVAEPTNAVDLLRQLLQFAGYYFFIATGDLFTIRRLRPPFPDETTRTINNTYRIRNNWSSWDANWSGAVREVTFKYGHDMLTGKFKRVSIFKLNDADLYSKGVARTLSFESKLIYPGGSNIPGDVGSRSFDVDAWLLNRRDYFLNRYARPPPIVKERVDYSFLSMELGELVVVVRDWMPDLAGNRGLNMVGEVVGKSVDESSRTVELTILMTGYLLGRYRYIGASHVVEALTDLGTEWRIEAMDVAHSSYDADASSFSDMQFNTAGGTPFYFFDRLRVTCWKADFSAHETVDVVGYGSDYLQITKPGSFTMAVGDIITCADFDEEPTLYDTFGAFSVSSELVPSGDTPHKFFPA